jgi:hypothetical protein
MGEQETSRHTPPKHPAIVFLSVLLAPTVLAALICTVMGAKPDTLSILALVDLPVGLICSIYCAWWLGRKFGQSRTARVTITLLACVGLLLFYFSLFFVGCLVVVVHN